MSTLRLRVLVPPVGVLVAEVVYDRWWPWRLGVVAKRTKTIVRVRWSDGETWKYDRAHRQFLSRYTPPDARSGREEG